MTEKVSMEALESEFGLEGNVPAAESDAAVAEAGGEDAPGADRIPEPATPPSVQRTLERTIQRAEALDGIDDNLERFEKERELDAEEAAAAPTAEEDDGGVDEELAAEAEAEAEPEAEAEGEAEAETELEAEAEGEVQDDDGAEDPLRGWLKKNVPDKAAKQELLQALMEEGVTLPYKAGGAELEEDLPTILRKAAGYAGEEEVTRRSQAAKQTLTEAQALAAQAKRDQEAAEARIHAFQEQINDPEVFGSFLTSSANLDYLKALHSQIDDVLTEAESNPTGFAMSRRLAGIEGMLQELKGGGGPARDTGNVREDAEREAPAAALDPTNIPDDLGFIRGEGYPSQFSAIAKRETQAIIEAATAAGIEGVTYDAAVQAWVKEGKTRPIKDVAKALLTAKRRDGHKLNLAGVPPRKRTPSSSRVGGGKKPVGGPREKPVAWDDIPAKLAADLAAARAGRELKS